MRLDGLVGAGVADYPSEEDSSEMQPRSTGGNSRDSLRLFVFFTRIASVRRATQHTVSAHHKACLRCNHPHPALLQFLLLATLHHLLAISSFTSFLLATARIRPRQALLLSSNPKRKGSSQFPLNLSAHSSSPSGVVAAIR